MWRVWKALQKRTYWILWKVAGVLVASASAESPWGRPWDSSRKSQEPGIEDNILIMWTLIPRKLPHKPQRLSPSASALVPQRHLSSGFIHFSLTRSWATQLVGIPVPICHIHCSLSAFAYEVSAKQHAFLLPTNVGPAQTWSPVLVSLLLGSSSHPPSPKGCPLEPSGHMHLCNSGKASGRDLGLSRTCHEKNKPAATALGSHTGNSGPPHPHFASFHDPLAQRERVRRRSFLSQPCLGFQ